MAAKGLLPRAAPPLDGGNSGDGGGPPPLPPGESVNDGIGQPPGKPVLTSEADVARSKLRPKNLMVPPWPNVATLPNWKVVMARNLVVASVYDDKREVGWLNQVEAQSFDELADSGEERFKPLDHLMVPALLKIVPNQLALLIQNKENEAMARNSTINGRQVVFMIYEWLKTDEYLATVFSISDLTDIVWMGDRPAEMQRFLTVWDNIIRNLEDKTAVNEKTMRDLMFRQMKKSTALSEEVAHFNRQRTKGSDAEDFTYTFLRRSIERHLALQRQERNLADRKAAMTKPFEKTGGGAAAPAAKTRPKPGARGRSAAGSPSNRARASSSGTGRGREGGSGTPRGAEKLGDKPKCYFYNLELRGREPGCTKGKDCSHVHDRIPDNVFATMQPPGARSKSPTGDKKGKGKGKGKGTKPTTGQKKPFVRYCHNFYRDGTCKIEKEKGTCPFPHLTSTQVEEERAKVAVS